MSRIAPRFNPLKPTLEIREQPDYLSLVSENGFQHIRNLDSDSFQIQISRQEIPDFTSYSLHNPIAGRPDVFTNEDEIRTGPGASFSLSKNNFAWSWMQENKLILQTESGIGFGFLGEESIAAFHLEDWQNFFGLGEKTGSLNRRAAAFTNWNTDAFAYGEGKDPLYVSIPFYMAVKDGVWYGVLVDNHPKTRFNFGASNRRMVQISVATGPLNLIFIPGPKPEDVLRRYHRLTGFMALPPRWALGLQQCRYSYYPEHELRMVAQNYRRRNIPCDVLYLDIHYMDAYKVFTVDKTRFPDLKKLCDDLLNDGFRVVPIQDPGIKAEHGYQPYDSGKEKDLFVKYPDGQEWIAGVWPGDCAFPDFTSARAREWWSSLSSDWIKETGVSGLWNDMNEPSTWGQDVPDLLEFDMDGQGGSHREAHNVYGQLMAQASRQGLEKARPNERPFVLSRAGFAGIHRTAAIWSGDNVANEEHFFLGIRIMLGMAISGVSFSGPDVGGFVGDSGRDLFVRWVSVASFFPFFRIHSMIDSRDNEPWSYGELGEAIAGNYIRLRYKLLPVLYSAFYESSKTGKPVVRPWFWEKAGHDFNAAFQHQFFLGKDILVIPASPQQHAVQAELPPGGWYRLFSGEFHEGSRVHWLSAWLDRLPVLVRQGAILLSRDTGHCSDEVQDIAIRDIHIFSANDGQGEFFLYEDDGITSNPAFQDMAEIRIVFRHDLKELQIHREAGERPVLFRSLFLWHFPHGVQVRTGSEIKTAEPFHFEWLEKLPNFDPFEEKGRSYYSECQRISLEGFKV